ncbi:MAG TPA: hypothetical protein VNL92_03050 [Dehalococcoidia bacterium]|nr:hypothetical protein [Dehalococcoidia bacterium]
MEGGLHGWRRAVHLAGAVLLLVAVNITVGVPWQSLGPHNEGMELGLNFSCRRARHLMSDIDCLSLFETMLTELQPGHVRLALYWDELEPERGVFDYSSVDPYLRLAEQHDVGVVPIIGVKSTYRPEFYIPEWVASTILWGAPPSDDDRIAEASLAMLAQVVGHLQAAPAIEAWQVENEPDVHPDGDARGWTVPNSFLAREVAVVRDADPAGRPVILTDDTSIFYQREWIDLLALGDGLGLGFYPRRPGGVFPWQDELRRFDMGALGSDHWNVMTRARLEGKQAWIVEVQAEPWQTRPASELRPDEITSVSPEIMRENVDLASRTGAERAYLWGVEWWWFQRVRWQDDSYWDTARDLLRGN